MKNYKELISGNFGKNVLMITSGAAFSQVLNILLSPIITRLYSPDEYALISIYVAVLGSLSFLGAFNYDKGIPIAKNDVDAINIVALSLIVLLLSTSLLLVLLLLFNVEVLIILKGSLIKDYYYMLPLGIFLIGLYGVLMQWTLREKNFKSITKTKYSQTITQNGISILFGIFNGSALGLMLGKIMGQSAGSITLLAPLVTDKRHLIGEVSIKKILEMAKRYISFPLFTTPRRYVGDLTISIPVLLMTTMYGENIAGYYGLASSVIQLPMSLIGTSISNVYYAECATLRYSNPKRIKELSAKLLKVLILIGVIPIVILIVWGPSLFLIVFGDNWKAAGEIARLLSISVFSRFIFKPISNIFDIYEKQKISFFINILRLIMTFAVFIISKYFNLDAIMTIGFYSLIMAIMYYVEYLIAQRIINNAISL